METFLTQRFWRHNIYLALGVGVGLVVAKRLKKPVRSLLVSATRSALNLTGRVTSMTKSVKEEFKSIMDEAREEVCQKKMDCSEVRKPEAGSREEHPAQVIEPAVHEAAVKSDRMNLP